METKVSISFITPINSKESFVQKFSFKPYVKGGGGKEGRGDSTSEMVRNRVVERLKILFNCRTNSPYRHRQMPKEVSEDARLL